MNKEPTGLPRDNQQLLTTSVPTVFGLRDIRFFWGGLADLVKPDSVVVISTNRYQPKIVGMAWRSLCDRFPELKEQQDDFKEVLVSGPKSYHWPLDEAFELKEYEKYGQRNAPDILVGPPGKQDHFERVFVVRHSYGRVRKDGFGEHRLRARYEKVLKACFPAIKSVEADDLLRSGKESLYGNIILTTLVNPERYKEQKTAIFNSIFENAETWLKASPMWKTVDVVCWWPDMTAEEAKDHLKKLFGQKKINLNDNLKNQIKDVWDNLLEAIRKIEERSSENSKNDKRVLAEMNSLVTTFGPQETTSTLQHYGNSVRIFTETLVVWFAREFFGPGIATAKNDLAKNIEIIRKQHAERKGHASQWFVEYLDSLRVLGNKCSHSGDHEELMFPESLQEEDLVVLLSCLKRVLDFQISWLEK